jgi:excisionase family DNA binding protein
MQVAGWQAFAPNREMVEGDRAGVWLKVSGKLFGIASHAQGIHSRRRAVRLFRLLRLFRLICTMTDMPSNAELPNEEIAREARQAHRGLSRITALSERHIRLEVDGGEHATVTVPRAAFDLFLEVLGQMAHGNAVTIVPVHAELTTQQAADLLNVSRPHLVSLLEAHELPYRMVGTHRRVLFSDLMAYRQQQDAHSRRAVAELSQQSQELDFAL